MMALARLDLPDWVAPALSQCGTTRKSITHGCPVSSIPTRTVSSSDASGVSCDVGERVGAGGQEPDPARCGRGDADGVDPPGVGELLGRAGVVAGHLAVAQPDADRPAHPVRAQQAQAGRVRDAGCGASGGRE